MKLKRFLLRYYPPGVILEYELRDKTRELKEIDLLHLTVDTDIEVIVNQIVFEEPLISESKKPHLRRLIYKLIEKLGSNETSDFFLFKILRAHILPLTNCAFNKSGDKFITGSYDRTCKVWNTISGDELLTLEGHRNVVYAIAFNNPYGDKIITGSFDKTCKLWSAETGQLYHTYRGHATEIVCLSFNPHGTMIATGSMDNTSRLWDVETGECLHTLLGHTAEIVSLDFDTQGQRIITGSFDNSVRVWDVRTGRTIHTLTGHAGEISSCQFNYASDLCISGSIDRTCKVWDMNSGTCVHTLRGHNDEILDVSFNTTGSKLVTASADGNSRVYNTMTGACHAILTGHEGEISKVAFNPQGSRILTASSDKTARVWETDTGDCLQVLEGHTDEIFSCAFNYDGDTIITGSKDNTCRIWKFSLMSLISGPYLVVGDEENFLAYEERVVYEMQKILRAKEGMSHFAVLDLCARLEDLIYNDTMKQFHVSSTATGVWSKREAIDSFVLKCDVLLRGMESKPMNWKKIFEDNTHNTKGIYDAIVKEEKERKPKGGSTGDAARDSAGKSSRSRKQGTGTKGGKARSAKGKTALSSNSSAFPAFSVGASLDVAGQMMYAPPTTAVLSQAPVPVPDLLLDQDGDLSLHDDNFPDFGFDFSESNGYL